MIASTVPDNSAYVVAAYLVLVALLLIYFVIMAVRLKRMGRVLEQLEAKLDERGGSGDHDG